MDTTVYRLRLFTLLGAVFLVAITGYNVYTFAVKISTKADQRAQVQQEIIDDQTTVVRAEEVSPETEYSNPLDEENQYTNPFDEYQNPFDE